MAYTITTKDHIGMTSFKDREGAFEAKFVHDEELRFLETARRDKLFVHWGLAQLHLPEQEVAKLRTSLLSLQAGPDYDARLTAQMSSVLLTHGARCQDIDVTAALESCTIVAKQLVINDIA